jgi:hypothetical protein
MGEYVSKYSGRLAVFLVRGKGYVVIDEQANSLTDPTPFRLIAEGLRAKLQREADLKVAAKLKQIKRPCLCCSKVFASEGIHNRLCSSCQADPAQLRIRDNLRRRG